MAGLGQPIYVPQKPRQQINPWVANLQQMLMQTMFSQQAAKQRSKETQSARQFALEREGYTTQAPATGMQMKEGQIPEPDVTIGGKEYYTPKITIETKRLPDGGTATYLKRGPRPVSRPTITQPQGQKKGDLFRVQGPRGPMYYEHLGQGQFRPTGLPAPSKAAGAGAAEKLTDLKLETWKKYLKEGKVKKEEMRLIGLDKDPFLAEAADAVRRDPRFMVAPVGKAINEIMAQANRLRMAKETEITGQAPPKVVDPLGLFE